LNRLRKKRTIVAWSLYDFANSSFSTIVLTFVYSTYFTKAIAENEIIGASLWSRAVTISALLVAFASPLLGSIADRRGLRKRFLLICTSICIMATVGLYFPVAGQVLPALAIFVVANSASELGNVFYNAFLPDIASEKRMGRISGWAWGLGYVGGILCTILAMVALVSTDSPWFGFAKEAGENIRATNLLVALWFTIFCIPLFLFVKESTPTANGTAIQPYRMLLAAFRDIKSHKQVTRFLIARLFYNDGLVAIFSFGGIYAAGTFGFTFDQIMVLGIVMNMSAGAGAFIMGSIDDRLGGKTTIYITLTAFLLGSIGAVLAQSQTTFWIAGITVSLFAGPNQSASRSLMGRFVPRHKINEFYGFFSFSGKVTAFLGPLMIGELTRAFGSQRIGVSSIILLFILGGILLSRVNEASGIAEART
jgi:UMF1 family MFS transporter